VAGAKVGQQFVRRVTNARIGAPSARKPQCWTVAF